MIKRTFNDRDAVMGVYDTPLRKMVIRIFLLLLLPILATAQTRVRVMEWNVENLFDTQHDTLRMDDEFLPDSERRWTPWRYWNKLNDVARTIMAVGATSVPDIVGLCEVENDSVMYRLATSTAALKHLGYEYIITDSPDVRGIDCALMYQPLRFGLIDWRAIRISSAENGYRPTRDILYARGTVGDGDTLHVLVCHLPSQRGGREAKRHRTLAVKTLQHVVDSLKDKPLVVMGDFNTHAPLLGHVRRLPLDVARRDSIGGTYRYQGDWTQLDHVFVSSEIKAAPLSVGRFLFLLEPNVTHGGVQPRRTYRGPAYHGGVSDHLPVWTDMELCPVQAK